MRKATSLACVVELGETGSSLKPARCDDTTGNHANHFLRGFRASRLSAASTSQESKKGGGAGRPPKTPHRALSVGRMFQAGRVGI